MNRCYAVLCCSLALFTLALQVASAEPRKLAVISYMQETCTFCPGGDTEIEDRAWRVPYVKGDDLIDRERGFIGGFVHAAGEYPDIRVIGQGFGHGLVKIGTYISGICNKVEAIEEFQIGSPGRRPNRVGRIGPAVPDRTIFIRSLFKHPPNLV